MMKAYVLPTGRRLYPFDDLPSEWRVLDRPLPELQKVALAACGCELQLFENARDLPAQGQYLALSDALYASEEALTAFLKAAKRGGRTVQAVAAPGPFVDTVLWHLPKDEQGGVPLPLWYHAGDGRPAEPLLISLDEEILDLPMPAHMGTTPTSGLQTLLTRYVLVEIESWVNLYQANVQALLARTKRAKHERTLRTAWAWLRGGGTLYGAMGRLNTIGKNCDIHPTAVIELSVIGDGARIGAHAVVRSSVVGKNAVIDDHASVRACVVGEGASIANNNNVIFCVVYPRAFLISGPYQFSMFGYETAIMHCICCDTRLDGRTIRAEVGPGKSVDSRQRYLGTCYGHGVRAGAGTITAPGRAIPNHIHFLPHPMLVVNQVDHELPRRKSLFTEGGGLTFKGRDGARPQEVTLSAPMAVETAEAVDQG
jgi:carbonic anhydrase/acetyltransferase-like protein (isoleucine patch superfamily)